MTGTAACAVRATATTPGAIAVIELIGDTVPVLAALTGLAERGDWPVGRVRLVDLGGVDRGLAGRAADDVALLMPHGGPHVVARLLESVRALGVEIAVVGGDPAAHYPEASDVHEARMLAALGRARSPLAIDLLLDQPRRWRDDPPFTGEDTARSGRLNRLMDPPVVVVAGPPDVGKSTLTNALVGRTLSITMDHPGTTRDYTAGLVDLRGLVVRWHDTPGLRETDDPIEREAISLVRPLMAGAACLIAMTDAAHDWPELPREPDLRVAGKSDLGPRRDADLSVCALRAEGLEDLTAAVRELLVPAADLSHPGVWRFW